MTNRKKALIGLLFAGGCSAAYAASYNRTPSSTFANASTTCGAIVGNQCYITDCLTDACTVGGGTADALSQYNGSAWVLVAPAVAGGVGSLAGTTADTFGLDTDGDNLTLDPQAGGLTLDRVASGTVTLTASDNDATAALTVDPGGAAQLTLGSADVTAIVHISDADTQLQNGVTGNVDLTFHDYADTTDDDQAHGQIRVNCTDAGAGAEDCDLSIAVAEAGAAPENRLVFDADGDITIGSANNAGFLVFALNAAQRNNATGTVTLAFQDWADTTDDDQDHARIQVNCTDTGSGSEDCDMSLSVVEAGAAPEARLLFDADAGVTIGSANNNLVTLTTDSTGNGELVAPDDSIGAAEIGDDVCTSVIAVSYNPTEAGGTDDYVSLIAVDTGTGDASFGTTESAEDQFIVPVAMRAANLRVDTATAPGVGNDDWRITLREAAGAEILTCDIAEAGTSCTDVANIATLAAGAAINFQVTSSTGGGADPTASAEMRISFCLNAD